MEQTTTQTFTFSDGKTVNRLGYGAMRLTGQPGNFGPYKDWPGGIELLQRAYDLGVNFFDSAWAYGPEYADRIVGEALGDSDAFFATKGGLDKLAPTQIVFDGSRDRLLTQIDQALVNLKRERIDLFQLHRIDPRTPLEESLGALREAQEDGRIGHIGLSQVTREQLDQALTIAPIASIQNRFNKAERADLDLVRYTAEKGIAFIPYGPLGADPRKQGAVLHPREALVWLLELSSNIIVIPGTTNIRHLEQNADVWDFVA